MLNCKEASLLASKQMDSKLTWRERIGLRLHVSLCDLCSRYLKDLNQLRVIMRKTPMEEASALPETIKLSEQDRLRIHNALLTATNSEE
jgi:hypothetical protein